MEQKNGKKPQCQTYPPREIVGKCTTQRKDVGKALILVYVPKRPDLKIKQMMPQVSKEHPKKQIMPKHPPQANQTQNSLI